MASTYGRNQPGETCRINGPTLPEQEQFWNSWNERWRTGELDYFMRRQAEAASSVARRLSETQQHVLDIGYGTN